MKTTKVIFLGLFFALIASVSSAQEAAGFTASITESEKPHAVLIQLSGLDGARTAVSISNARGITAYREYLWNEAPINQNGISVCWSMYFLAAIRPARKYANCRPCPFYPSL
ncbi:MAG: hypothetical protein KDD10_20725 [Phaeodactylibacter sp.]|nr:hypothetical protein [Phaeodactylibacter sp.]